MTGVQYSQDTLSEKLVWADQNQGVEIFFPH